MRTEEKREPDQETKELANAISRWVNCHSCRSNPDLIALLAQDHRTLQQKFTAVCLAWLVHLSNLNENWYDLRNEASVKIAKEIRRNCPDIDCGLPLI